MQPPFIKAELQIRGCRPRRLAERLGITESAVHRVIDGKARSRRIAKEISRVTGIPLETLFPGKYDAARGKRRQVARVGR